MDKRETITRGEIDSQQGMGLVVSDETTEAHVKALVAQLDAAEREFHKIFDYLEPHWRGAGLKPTAEWAIKEIAGRYSEKEQERESLERDLRAALERVMRLEKALEEAQGCINQLARHSSEPEWVRGVLTTIDSALRARTTLDGRDG